MRRTPVAGPAYGVLALVAVLLAGSSTNASAQEEESSGSRVHLMLGASLSNDYNRGDLDTWFGELTGSTRQVDAGSPAFFIGRLTLLGSGSGSSLGLGIAVGAAVPVDRSLWGTQTIFGGRTELVLNPFIAHVALPLRMPLSQGENVTVSIAPTMLMALTTGHLNQGEQRTGFSPGPGFGLGGTLSLVVLFAGALGFSLEAGARVLEADIVWKDSSRDTGFV